MELQKSNAVARDSLLTRNTAKAKREFLKMKADNDGPNAGPIRLQPFVTDIPFGITIDGRIVPIIRRPPGPNTTTVDVPPVIPLIIDEEKRRDEGAIIDKREQPTMPNKDERIIW